MGFSLLWFFKSFAHTNSVAGGGDVRETRGHCGLYFSIPDERVTPSAKCWPGRNSLAAAGYINDYDNQKTWRSANSVGISFLLFLCGNISNLAIFYYFTFIVETERNKIEPKTLLLSPIGRGGGQTLHTLVWHCLSVRFVHSSNGWAGHNTHKS